MKQTCDYCDSIIKDTDEVCPNCGAPNSHVVRLANGLPKTIDELKAYAEAHNLPLKQMRFFIGENCKEPKAFGIYEENGVFTVYKNKADGTRSVRYSGRDEAYAVNELYQKMHSEIQLRKNKKAANHPTSSSSSTPSGCAANIIKSSLIWIIIGIIILIIAITGNSCGKGPSRGYYTYDNDVYYYQHGDWYGFDDNDGWIPVVPVSGLTDSYGDYFNGTGYQSGNGYSDFSNSSYYHDDSYWNSDDDWDDDSWDNDTDWDSGDTDWDSDW